MVNLHGSGHWRHTLQITSTLDHEFCDQYFVGAGFSYQPLVGPKELRLLVLEPGQPDDEVRCNLIHHSLEDGENDEKSYTALSYVWGDASASFLSPISCNGAYLRVTPNLKTALRHVRSFTETVTLWVDQICINQADKKERCAQVQIMRDVYLGAVQVVAWLGDSSEHAKVAFDFVHVLQGEIEEGLAYDFGSKLQEWGVPSNIALGLIIAFELDSENPGWRALRRLFERPWFQRVWIIQEAILARDLKLQWGSERIDWNTVADLVAALDSFQSLAGRIFFEYSTTCAKILIEQSRLWSQLNTVPLEGLLTVSSSHNSTDPRDKIYALLGLIKNESSLGIVPRYDIPVDALYRYVTGALIQHMSSLWILCHSFQVAQERENMPDLPSWSPDYSYNPNQPESLRPFVGWDQFKADLGAPFTVAWHKDPKLMTLRCKLFDTLNGEDDVFFNLPIRVELSYVSNKTIVSAFFTQIKSLLASCKHTFQTAQLKSKGNTTFESYQRALIGGLDESTKPASPTFVQHCDAYEEFADSLGQDERTLTAAWSYEKKTGCSAYGRCLVRTGNRRSFTATACGRLGWLPAGTAAGDRIAVLYGSRFPWILRRCGRDNEGAAGVLWKMIGHCYIEGAMFGEIMSSDEFVAEDITLC